MAALPPGATPLDPAPRFSVSEPSTEFTETRSVTLEWKISNLKTLFENSKGDVKSRCVKSALFDAQRWQIFFYPNSGHEQYCSLYLSCEPTATEKEKGAAENRGWGTAAAATEGGGSSAAVGTGASASGNGIQLGKNDNKGPWKREGKYKFTFEARSVDRRMTFKVMEAHDHSFSDTARNWGYASFLKRSDAYFNNQAVRMSDALLIICTIVSSPTPPSPPPLPRLLIPKDLVNAYASLFDDPGYSDVVFRIRPANKGGREKRLYAAKKVLAGRCEYFDTMFSSGFSESSVAVPMSLPPSPVPGQHQYEHEDSSTDVEYDSDEADWDEDDDSAVESEEEEDEYSEDEEGAVEGARKAEDVFGGGGASVGTGGSVAGSVASSAAVSDEEVEEVETDEGSVAEQVGKKKGRSSIGTAGFVDAPGSPIRAGRKKDEGRTPTRDFDAGNGDGAAALLAKRSLERKDSKRKVKRPMFEVVVTDAAYTTFRALLFWLYTDSITFAPLASTYHVARESSAQLGVPFPFASRRAYLLATAAFHPKTDGGQVAALCSAKAIYRLADKIGLPDLKDRAYEHIVKSLTVENIPYEVFGSFSLRFEEVRRVEIGFLCEKWNEVRVSPSMRKVLSHVRTMGRFPGFEEVWARILPNLEFKPGQPTDEERV